METQRSTTRIILAFAVIYLVWGSTFLAIRIGVHEVPPLIFAAMRFFTAGAVLYGWALAHGSAQPTRRQWRSAVLLAILIFLINYGLLFWAEQRVPSGVAAVMLATIPVFTTLAEIAILRTQRLTFRLVIALLIGIAGVAVLMSRSLNLGGAPIDHLGAIALIIAAFTWSLASVLTRKMHLPPSRLMNSGAQMLAGGALLALTALPFHEYQHFHPLAISRAAWLALLYLILAGSILGFTTYIWLIHHESPTKVGTYAYVNPVVAVLLGYFLASETLGLRTILGTLTILVSVIIITTTKSRPASTQPPFPPQKLSS